jgi:hypothetical protein
VHAISPSASATAAGAHSFIRVWQERLRRLLPLWGMLLAGALIVSRRPDAVTHAQFWAEDGKLYYANVYNHGLLATLVVPQDGYFQELPVLAAGLAQIVALAFAPLVTNLIAIAVRVLPVGLLLSRRAETISPDLRVRTLLAALYIGLPGAAETNATVVNAGWFLAVAAVIVLMLRPPASRSGHVLDLATLSLCAVTGVFCIALAPLAFLYRHWRGPTAVPRSKLAILTAGMMLQLLAILVLQYHLPSGYNATPRASAPLHATAQGFFQILGVRVVLGSVLGSAVEPSAITGALVGVLAGIGALLAFRRGGAELRLMIAFGGAMFAMALARSLGGGWPDLFAPPAGGRYFVIPQFAFVATLVWACVYMRRRPWLILFMSVLLCMCLFTIPREWAYPHFRETGFAHRASLFEHSRPGTRMRFPLEPRYWSMMLVKH